MQTATEVDVVNILLDTKTVEGKFTYKDGNVVELHNGGFSTNVVLWRAYPSWIPNFGSQAEFVEVNPRKG